jgi:hypothetical protein
MRRFLCGFMAFLAIGVALVAPLPWVVGAFEGAPDLPPLVQHLVARFTDSRLVFLMHAVCGGIALLVVPFQLMTRVRTRWRRVHKSIGYLYVGAVALAGGAGLVMAVSSWGGPLARAGFTGLAVAWLATTAIGLHRIVSGDRATHRIWMTRSFALAFAAVSLRIQAPLLAGLGVSDEAAYVIVAWSSWLPNLALAHVLVRRKSAGAVPVHRLNARVNELGSANPSR